MTNDERTKIHDEVHSYVDEEIISQDEYETKTKFYLFTNTSKYECISLYVNNRGNIELELKNDLNVKCNIKITLNKFKEIFVKNALF